MFSPQDALPLPSNPDLEHYKKRAKDLVKAANDPDPEALAVWAKAWIDSLIQLSNLRITPNLPVSTDSWIEQLEQFALQEKSRAQLSLTRAQFILARAHGFESWPKFAKHLAAIRQNHSATSAFEQAVESIIAGDQPRLESLLKANPALTRARSTREHQATLLHYVAANGVEGYRQKTPPNAVEIAELLLDAGADVNATADIYGSGATTLGLSATSIHPERAGLQQNLMELLLARGASMNDPGLVTSCLANGRLPAAEFLAHAGAPLTLESAAGLGYLEKVKSYFDKKGNLSGKATTQQFHRALFWSAEYGRNQVIEFLLDHRAPLDARSNDGQTPLHWAVIGGHLDTIQLLVSRGASLTEKNSYGGTPLGQAHWFAEHGPKHIDYAKVIETLVQAEARSNKSREKK
jgi:ankyrin repeat protein